MMRLLLACCMMMVATIALAQPAEDKIWQHTQQLVSAVFETKDSIALSGMLSQQLTYGHSGGNVEDKQLMIKNAVANTATYKGLTVERISVQVLKKTAIVRHLLRATTVDKGTEAPLNLHILLVWQKVKGEWKLVARQAVRVNSK